MAQKGKVRILAHEREQEQVDMTVEATVISQAVLASCGCGLWRRSRIFADGGVASGAPKNAGAYGDPVIQVLDALS